MQIRLAPGYYQVIGNATRDAEFKFVGSDNNTAMCKFSIASKQNNDSAPAYVDCVAWRHIAHVASSISKGDAVIIYGRLETREYNDKEYTSLVAEWLSFIPRCLDGMQSQPPSAPRPPAEAAEFEPVDDDDLPF